jgi:hypothetical protein
MSRVGAHQKNPMYQSCCCKQLKAKAKTQRTLTEKRKVEEKVKHDEQRNDVW